MHPPNDMSASQISLRSYDIALGFRNVDERSGALSDCSGTHITGMAAILAGTVKGRDIVKDGRKFKQLAADVLRISPYAFESVIQELELVGFIRNVRRSDNLVLSFTESIPLAYDDVHERLGESWLSRSHSELEQKFLATVDTLAAGPTLTETLREDLDVDTSTERLLRALGPQAELIRYYRLNDGSELAASPLYAFENPDTLVDLFERHPADSVRREFGRLKQQPGLPILMNHSDPIIEDMIRLGLVPAPTLVGSDNRRRSFVVLPYGVDPVYLKRGKHILDKAITLVACVRCGEVSGGVSRIRFPDALLAKLMDKERGYQLAGHSSTKRQYEPLIAAGMLRVSLGGTYPSIQLIPTEDNIDAVRLARVLLRRQGEGMPERGNEREAADLLFTGGDYLVPIETIGLARRVESALTQTEVSEFWANGVGWR